MRITESRIRQIIREETKLILCESDDNSSVLYTGIVVNYNDSVNLAVSHPTLPQKWLTSNIASHGNEQLNHHMTVTIGALHLNNPLRERLNEEIKLNVVGWGH